MSHEEECDSEAHQHLQDGFLYKLDKLYMFKGERLQLIKENHSSKVVSYLVMGNNSQLVEVCDWPKMQYGTQFINECMLFCTNKPSKGKQGLQHPLHVPTRTWESISKDFAVGLSRTMKGHEYLFVVVGIFSNMCILFPCKKVIMRKDATIMFFERDLMHFGILGASFWTQILDFSMHVGQLSDTIFLSSFWTTLYIQHSYNIKVHTSISKSPLETFFGYFPPSPLDLIYGQHGREKEDTTREVLKDKRFNDKIRQTHFQLHDKLKKSREKYKAKHDQYKIQNTFMVGD